MRGKMQQWEYLDVRYSDQGWSANGRVLEDGLDEDGDVEPGLLNRWGLQGWELISVAFDQNGDPTKYLFKRPRLYRDGD
jgi:hypothetical protein